LLAVLPLLVVAISVVVLMSMGIKINAAGIVPVLTTLFLLITIRGEANHKLTDVRRHIPFSLERKTSAQIMDIFSRYAQDEVNYRDGMAEIEKLLVTHKHSKNKGNVSVTAASMDIPRSSLYSIFRRLDINVKEQEKD
jgi:beta-lactamase superfamily II metal-dependent hydrolase